MKHRIPWHYLLGILYVLSMHALALGVTIVALPQSRVHEVEPVAALLLTHGIAALVIGQTVEALAVAAILLVAYRWWSPRVGWWFLLVGALAWTADAALDVYALHPAFLPA